VTESLAVTNRQEANVGNLGDILKHGALVALAEMLRRRLGSGPVNYLDTHAFRLRARLPNAGEWQTTVDRLRRRHPAYDRYLEVEEPEIATGGYLCSVGLAARTLGTCRMFLAESHGPTRRMLEAQLAGARLMPTLLLDDMHTFPEQDLVGHAGDLLALIDPFQQNEQEWRETWMSASAAVGGLHRAGANGVVLGFQFRRQGEAPLWLEPPPGFVGPLAQAGCRPYHLATYAAEGIAAEVTATLLELAWSTSPSSAVLTPFFFSHALSLPVVRRGGQPPSDCV